MKCEFKYFSKYYRNLSRIYIVFIFNGANELIAIIKLYSSNSRLYVQYLVYDLIDQTFLWCFAVPLMNVR